MSVISAGDELRNRVSAYATLLRIPNLFTAPPDVFLGAVLAGFSTTGPGLAVPLDHVVSLSVISVLLYGAGTTLNDYADIAVDAVERPERPIPSHTVSPHAAFSFGIGLLVAAVIVAYVLVNAMAVVVTICLAVMISLYDFYLKGTALGFGVMGLSRGFNVVLGMTAIGGGDFSVLLLVVPIVISGYIATVTWMAADEMAGGTQRRISVTRITTVGVALTVILLGVVLPAPPVQFGVSGVLIVGFLAVTNRQLRVASRLRTPATVGAAVGSCVLGLVLVDVAVIALFTLRLAAVTFGFLIVARVLSSRFDIS